MQIFANFATVRLDGIYADFDRNIQAGLKYSHCKLFS